MRVRKSAKRANISSLAPHSPSLLSPKTGGKSIDPSPLCFKARSRAEPWHISVLPFGSMNQNVETFLKETRRTHAKSSSEFRIRGQKDGKGHTVVCKLFPEDTSSDSLRVSMGGIGTMLTVEGETDGRRGDFYMQAQASC